ncbi:MAG: hypothetical protein AUK39_03070 [Dehalococcoidia bacterium CG2_30_46_19]|nr:MAG: hypothetical protein AUK39_03070 [Dehalococcoidia bacterium CG2_30_46_19]
MPQRAGQISKVVALACLLIVIIPLLFATTYGVSPSRAMELVGSTFALEYLAIPLGIALKLPPLYVFLTVVSTGIGIFILVLGIFHLLGAQSQRIVNFLLKLRGRVRRLQKYGIYGLIPGATLLGVYGCAALVWFLGWNIRQSTLFTIIGFVLISAIFLFSSIGILKIISPG